MLGTPKAPRSRRTETNEVRRASDSFGWFSEGDGVAHTQQRNVYSPARNSTPAASGVERLNFASTLTGSGPNLTHARTRFGRG